MSKRGAIICLSIATFLSSTVILLYFLLPFQSERVELCFNIVTLAGVPICIFLMLLAARRVNGMKYGRFAFAMLLAIGLAATAANFRYERAEKYRWDVHGVVVKKYKDTKQHNNLTIEVRTVQGVHVTLPGILYEAYVRAQVNSRIDKNAWSSTAIIGNRSVEIIR